MEKLAHIKSTVVPLNVENVDTDQIIPARFLKATDKKGFGDNLFYDWRYDENDNPVENFPLNQEKYSGKILLAGNNFGCGSSREHAAWAIKGHGFYIVISSFFADIFKGNALNNGLLPIEVPDDILQEMFLEVEKNPNTIIEVDVEKQLVYFNQKEIPFVIDAYKKTCLINGYDDIDYLVGIKDEIKSFEENRKYKF